MSQVSGGVSYFLPSYFNNWKENPYSAAQRFLERNDLPMSYLDQVVQFIEKNTAGVTLGVNNDFVDPFTGIDRNGLAACISGSCG